MDSITQEIDNKILKYEFDEKLTDVACFNKIRMDYFLMLTIAASWDLKKSSMDTDALNTVMHYLQRPETGKLIRLIDSGFSLDKDIVDIFNLYKEGRNLRFGHTTFDEFEARRLNSECKQCWAALMNLPTLDGEHGEIIRKLYQDTNDFYYIASIKQSGDMLVRQFGSKNGFVKFSKISMKARMANKSNSILEGDLFISVDGQYIKISPFIQYNDKEELFMMLMDIETSPLAFKMAYIYRTQYASDSVKYLDEFPKELKPYFPEKTKKLGKNGVSLNRFSQYELFEQDYCTDVHLNVQEQLDTFILGNMTYGAVRGVGGVGKTSAVFMWMNRILNNENGVLDQIRKEFNLRRIIFLSAKTRIYSREINEENLSNFYETKSDVCNYHEIVEAVYSAFHPQEKQGVIFEDKVNYIKNYSNQSHALLIIIDDYESLPENSREKIQLLKNDLNLKLIKILITTRFTLKESKDIIVERLSKDECARMTDYIFESPKWRLDLSPSEMHSLTGGLPLLIWYAKAFFKMGQLTSKRLKSKFSGPAGGLEDYLYDNFVQCFEDVFTKNFLMLVTRYYDLHKTLQISKKIAVFLCLAKPKEYKVEDEEFYFRELVDLKLISINQSTNSIDFSPLMTYMDKTKKRQEPKEVYQADSLKVLTHLDEASNKDLYAVIKSVEFLEDETKCRILERIVAFSQNDTDIKDLALSIIFALTDDKLKLYEENENAFQNSQILIKAMINYLLDNKLAIKGHYEIVRDFIKSVSVAVEKQDYVEQIASKGIELIKELLFQSLDERDNEKITNSELESRTQLLGGLTKDFFSKISDPDRKEKYHKEINELIDDISIFCGSDILQYQIYGSYSD